MGKFLIILKLLFKNVYFFNIFYYMYNEKLPILLQKLAFLFTTIYQNYSLFLIFYVLSIKKIIKISKVLKCLHKSQDFISKFD